MYVVPTLEDFQSDLLTIYVTDEYFFRLYIVDEYIEFDGVSNEARGIIMEAYITVGDETAVIKCPSIIGMKNDLVEITTEDPSMLGAIMSKSNLGTWGLEIVE